jgi:hypothetical protein
MDHPRLIGIEQQKIGGRALLEPTARQTEQFRRIDRHRAKQRQQANLIGMVQAQRRREQRFEADCTISRFRERAALDVGVLGIVARNDDVDIAGRQRAHHRDAIIFRTKRRADFIERAV